MLLRRTTFALVKFHKVHFSTIDLAQQIPSKDKIKD